MIAYLLVRRQSRAWVRATTVGLATAFATTRGLSRVYLRHHWLTDVLVAWTLGLAWLTVVVVAHRLLLTFHRHGHTLRRHGPGKRLGPKGPPPSLPTWPPPPS